MTTDAHDPTEAPGPVDDRFEVVTAAQRQRLFGLALSVLRDAHEAEDAVQETLVRAWRSWDDLREPAARASWLTTICVRYCLRRRDRVGRAVPATSMGAPSGVADDPSTDGQRPWSARAAATPTDVDLDRAFRSLPVRQRAAVYLHYYDGRTIEQCAELMGCRPGTVRTHVQRALATLRQEIGDG